MFPSFIYLTNVFLSRLHQNSNSTLSEKFWRVLIIAVCIALAELVTYSRIYLQYHSHSQVLCGAIVGIILGIIWFTIVHLVLTPFFPVIVSW
jgi:dolichyldiphosphatase